MTRSEPAPAFVDDARSRAALTAEAALFREYGLEPQTRWIRLPSTGIRVRVTVCGEGEPILVLPGGSGDAFAYVPLMAELRDRRWIAINRPGGGLSEALDHRRVDLRDVAVELVDAVLDDLEVERATLVSNSMGGLWAFWYAIARPTRVVNLVELGCPALLLGTSAPAFLRLLALPGIGGLVARVMQPNTPEAAARGLQRSMGVPTSVQLSRAFLETSVAMFALPTFRRTWQTLVAAVLGPGEAGARYPLGESALRGVEVPVLFIWGAQDPFGDPAVGRAACDLLPAGRLQVVGEGHLPHLENPGACAAAIRALRAPVGVGVGA